MLIWKNMTTGDLAHVLAIADVVHTDYPESPSVYEERLALFPQGCWVAVHRDDTHALPVGYAITHPGIIGMPPALDKLLGNLSVQADCLYLHDVAILPAGRASGLGSAIVNLAHSVAVRQSLQKMALIAVNQSARYWQRQGFLPYEAVSDTLQQKLTSYSKDAQYLVRSVF